MIDTEELHIIAKDGGRLDPADCEAIAAAADEVDLLRDELVRTQAALIETTRRLIAVNDAMIHLRRHPPFTPAMWVAKVRFLP
jgi:hypothetical protein